MKGFIEVTNKHNVEVPVLVNIAAIDSVYADGVDTKITTISNGLPFSVKESYEEVKRKMEEAVGGQTKVRKSETNPSRFTITMVRNKNKNGKYEVSQDDIQIVVNMACYRVLSKITDEYIEQDADEATPITPMFQFEEEKYND